MKSLIALLTVLTVTTTSFVSAEEPSETASGPSHTVARTPARLPVTVRLTAPIQFPAVLNGRVIGSVDVPAGSFARLVAVQGPYLVLDFQGGRQKVPGASTDFASRLEASSADAAPAADSAPASKASPTDTVREPSPTPVASYFGVMKQDG